MARVNGSTADAVRLDVAASSPLTVECVDDVWGFTALGREWRELLQASAADGPFLTWEWLLTWWHHLRGSARLSLLTVRAAGELLAIAPFRRSRAAVPWFSSLEFLGTGYAGSDYMDLVIRCGREDECLQAIAEFVRAQNVALRLDRLPETSAAGRLAERLTAGGWSASVTPDGACPVITLAGHSWDSYLATLGAAHRANVRRRLRELARQFDMQFEQVSSDVARGEALAALTTFHEQRWGRRGGSTAFLTPALRSFQEDVTRRALGRGWLRLYVLRLDGAPAAVMYGFAYNRRFYFYQHGFDDRYRRHSVGLALMALSIRAAMDEGAEQFDMLWGLEPYKWLWADEARPLRQIHLFPDHIAGRLQCRGIEAQRRLSRLARRALNTGGARGT